MRKLLSTFIGILALGVSATAFAIPMHTNLTLGDATNGTDLCLYDCWGSLVYEGPAGGITSTTTGYFDILELDVEIFHSVLNLPTGLVFGNLDPAPGSNYVSFQNGTLTDVFASTSTAALSSASYAHTLTFNGSDWTINAPYGMGYSGGGSSTRIPEPTSLALMGIGLLGFTAASRRRRKNLDK